MIYAIQGRESYLDVYRGDASDEGIQIRKETRDEIKKFKDLLRKKYNAITHDDWLKQNSTSV
ncbi:hypothetical protein [Caulobacter phage Cr30]|uniref:hypothetical protein n=1 Tax=Caulobacter phage Cr30 TaxID=1357714 RepID=UPI0004A9B521|nr:hypothetical protein OZ74_gp233 [Caulobacter phage Cr30]AGS81110.1 hypothetical protein [Caulobacter phage Cr30]